MRNTLEAQIAEMLAANPRPLRRGIGNDDERKCAALIEAGGGIPADCGWPDFAVFGKDGHLKAMVEVKPDKGRWQPRDHQLVTLVGFSRFELPCFVWSPSAVVRIDRDGLPRSATENDLIGLL